MREDASQITELQSEPLRAVDREKPNDELLTEIELALHEANVPRELWQDSIPQPPRRDQDSDYLQMTTRLMFERITLEQIATFGNRLLTADPTIRIVSLRIHAGSQRSARGTDMARWNVELAVAYLVYEPRADGSP